MHVIELLELRSCLVLALCTWFMGLRREMLPAFVFSWL